MLWKEILVAMRVDRPKLVVNVGRKVVELQRPRIGIVLLPHPLRCRAVLFCCRIHGGVGQWLRPLVGNGCVFNGS